MTIENDFLPFATAGGANVVTQAQYAALSALSTGYQAGVAASNQLNKTWRQSSIMSTVLAQFIVNSTGQPAIDDGTTATLLANLVAAISANSEAMIGSARNMSMSVSAASATATLTADEIVVGSALGGLKYTLASFSKTVNLATTGAGGMDTGSAPTSGFVALYAIYNPTTQTAALLATNAATKQGSVYGGAYMPSGYTASALVGVWPTNSSGQFPIAAQFDRNLWFSIVNVLSTTTATGSTSTLTPLTISTAVPANARTVSGTILSQNTAASITNISLGGMTTPIGAQSNYTNIASASGIVSSFSNVPLVTSQTLYYGSTSSAGTPSIVIGLSGYTI